MNTPPGLIVNLTADTSHAEAALELAAAETELAATHAYVTELYKDAIRHRHFAIAGQLARVLFFMDHGKPNTDVTEEEMDTFEDQLRADTDAELAAEREAKATHQR